MARGLCFVSEIVLARRKKSVGRQRGEGGGAGTE